jgi:ketosteroid isomerase-like protein
MSVEERLDRIESKLAIADLVHDYARAIRHNRTEDIAGMFAPDSFFEVRGGHPSQPDYAVQQRFEGAKAIGEFMMQGKGRPHPVPLVHNLMIEVDGDRASGLCAMEGQVYGTEHKIIGEYRDSYVRIDGRWKFASRTYTMYTAASSM